MMSIEDGKRLIDHIELEIKDLRVEIEEQKQLIKLIEFKNHLHTSTETMLDTNSNEAKYDYTISMNGRSLTLQNNADLYDAITQALQDEIDHRSQKDK